jgi:hypothetical protein
VASSRLLRYRGKGWASLVTDCRLHSAPASRPHQCKERQENQSLPNSPWQRPFWTAAVVHILVATFPCSLAMQLSSPGIINGYVSWYVTCRRLLLLRSDDCIRVSDLSRVLQPIQNLPEGTMMMMSRMRMPTKRQMRIFMSFHHICLRTRLAPLRKPCAETARLSVLSCSESRRAPRSDTLLMLSLMIPTVLSISCDASQCMRSYMQTIKDFEMRIAQVLSARKHGSVAEGSC